MTATSADDAKRRAAVQAADLVASDALLGLGTGSTAKLFVNEVGARLADGRLRDVRGVATSKATASQAAGLGIPLMELDDVDHVDVTVDGADEVDPRLDLVKGLGGALLREKIVAGMSDEVVIIVDESKLVERLGRGVVPLETLPFAVKSVARHLDRLGGKARPRERDGAPFVSDNGNPILDASFGAIADPARLERDLNAIPGVVENGLFVGLATKVIVGGPSGTRLLTRR